MTTPITPQFEPDGVYLVGDDGTIVRGFATVAAAEEFLDWMAHLNNLAGLGEGSFEGGSTPHPALN